MKNIKYTIALIIAASVALSACKQPAEDPKTIADKYWQFMRNGNVSEAKKLASADSVHTIQEHSSRMNSATQISNSEATTTVTTTITTTDPGNNNYRYSETFTTVLVLQQGEWKVDLSRSQIPSAPSAREQELQKLADDLSESMQENIESIDDAMSEGMQLFNEALRDGSKEMGDSLLNLMNNLNDSMKESIDKMKERREQQMQDQQQAPQPQPDPDKGEGMI